MTGAPSAGPGPASNRNVNRAHVVVYQIAPDLIYPLLSQRDPERKTFYWKGPTRRTVCKDCENDRSRQITWETVHGD